ncbi:hypothetical protein [Clostridium botulinum]|uniref:hypothetical protein n=1 Tax=Clostridium botulinum TaxID=1491 RepID=UPI001C9B65D2|nr:hypothetical protein [Clostridium botulinum]MBY6842736.1 hypothetical protein [Clostridium botulinum]
MSTFSDTSPILIKKRKGTSTDPFKLITENLKIINNVAILNEIPDNFRRVNVKGMVEKRTDFYNENNNIDENEYIVDYKHGYVFFNEKMNNKTVKAEYLGTGVVLYPASRIYDTGREDVIVTIQEMINGGREAIEAYRSIDNAIKTAEEYYAKISTCVDGVKEISDTLNISIVNGKNIDDILNKTIEEATKINDTLGGTIINGTNKIAEIDNIIQEFSVCEEYDSEKEYKKLNRVSFKGSFYECIKDCKDILPSNKEYWNCVAEKGKDGKDGEGSGNMHTEKYDKDEDGVVDFADDSNKLGGKLAKEYALKSEVSSNTNNANIKSFKNTVILEEEANKVKIGISEFNMKIDELLVYQNGIYIEKNEEYKITSDGLYIENVYENWDKNTIFNFIMYKGVKDKIEYEDGALILNSSITLEKLNLDIQNKINSINEKLDKKDLDEKINSINSSVQSVNSKKGIVELKATDIKTENGETIEEKLKNIKSGDSDKNSSGMVGTKEVDETTIEDEYVLRYDKNKDKLVYSKGNIDKIPPTTVKNFTAKKGNAKVVLTWENPIDYDFAGVKILRKENEYPKSIVDGTVIYVGANTTYVDTTVTNDTTYYYRIFPYDTSDNYNTIEDGQTVIATPKAYVIYGVKIDTTNSSPETALTYTDMAVGFTPANGNNGDFQYGSWEGKFPFNKIKPCLYKDGEVNYYLAPNDYTKKIDDSDSDVISGDDGDVMVEFPKIYWKFERIGTDIYIRYSNAKIDDDYKCLAHMRGDIENDKCYISAYLGFEMSSKLRSLSDKIPTGEKTISVFRDLAQANGEKYNQMAYFQLLMLQVLFIVMFKNRDSQTALGKGYVNNNQGAISTGNTNAKGLFFGENTGKMQNKFCGIEDFWGNYTYWIDGLYCDGNRNILIGNKEFNDKSEGYVDYGKGGTSDISGYLSDIQGTTEKGFLAKEAKGSETTYYADVTHLCSYKFPRFGGQYKNGSSAGAFYLDVYYSLSEKYATTSSRIFAL